MGRIGIAGMKEKPDRQGVQGAASIAVPVHSVTGKDFRKRNDDLAVEEPVEFRIVTEENGRSTRHSIIKAKQVVAGHSLAATRSHCSAAA